jgi:hypothetical protein
VQLSAEMSELTSLLYQVGSLANVSAQQAMLSGSGGSPVVLEECPSVVVAAVGLIHLEMALDYGDEGCTTDWGLSAEGQLGITLDVTETVDTIVVEFSSFSVEGYSISGTFDLVGKGPSWTFSYTGIVGGLYYLSMEYTVEYADMGTPFDWTDDVATVGGGGVATVGAIALTLWIDDPLTFVANCQNPISGELAYSVTSDGDEGPEIVLDFGTGDCCTATASVGPRTGEIDLCTVEGSSAR